MTGRWVECRHRALDDGARLSLYRDITDAKEREAELERQSAILSTITANMDGGIVVFDKDNRLVAWNTGFTDLVGVDPALARHGTTLREILVSQAKAGEFGPVRSGGRGRSAHRRLPWRPRARQRTHAAERAHRRAAPQSDSRAAVR